MKKIYQAPCIETAEMESFQVLNGSDTLTNIQGKSGGETIFGYGGGGNGPARSGENNLWDDEDNGSDWDNL